MRKLLFICISGLMLLAGCQENITVDLPQYKSKLAVFCIMMPDSTPVLFVNRSKSFFDYGDTAQRSSELVRDAQVVITDATTGMHDTLKLDSGFLDLSYAGGNSSTAVNFRTFYRAHFKAQSGHRYTMDVQQAGDKLSAETVIPQKVAIEETKVYSDSSFGVNYRIEVKFHDEPARSNGYQVYGGIYYSLYHDTSTGQTYDHYILEGNHIFLYDNGSDGQQLTMENYMNSYYGGIDTLTIPIVVENLTRETAKYLEAVYSQEYSFDDPFSEPVLIPSNVSGGLGLFGSAARSDRKWVKVK